MRHTVRGARPRKAGGRCLDTAGRGCKPPPAGQDECHQHRSSRLDPSASRACGLVFRIRVSKCRLVPAPGRAITGIWPVSCARTNRWHRPSSVAGGGVWTKLPDKSTTYSLTLVKHIIGGAAAATSGQAKSVMVDEESAGQRLDNFLIRQLKGVPKTHVYRIIRSGEVRVNSGRAAADTRVAVATWCGFRRCGHRRAPRKRR